MQEAYWDGGNDNEVVICIGMNSTNNKIDWVKAFSWSPNRRIIPEVREEIMNIGFFNPEAICRVVEKSVVGYYKRKDFKEFSYLTVEPPEWAKWVTAIVTALITFLISRWATINQSGPGGSFRDFFTREWKNRW
jgi:hypothetical protein